MKKMKRNKLITVLMLLCLSLASVNLLGQANYDERIMIKGGDFYAVSQNGKWGVCDMSLREIIAPKYQNIKTTLMIGDCFVVSQNGKWGICDMSGQEIISPKYDDVSKTGDYVKVEKAGKWGVCNMSGQEIIAPRYNALGKFGNYFAVRQNGKWGICDMSGQEIITPRYDDIVVNIIGDYFGVKQKDKWGVCNEKGQEIIAPKYDELSKLNSSNYFGVKKKGKWGVCDMNGHEIMGGGYGSLESSMIGDYFLFKENDKYGIYDLENKKQILAPRYRSINVLVDSGLCEVNEDGKYSIYDLKNEQQIPELSNYDKVVIKEVRTDGNGTMEYRYEVKKNGKEGVCDIHGKEIIAPNLYDYLDAWNIEDCHFYIVKKDDKSGVCDQNGREIMVPNYFDYVSVEGKRNDFYYIVEKEGRAGVYDMFGMEIIEPKYQAIYWGKKGGYNYFRVKYDNMEGVCDLQGRVIVEPIYSDVWMRGGKGYYYYQVKKGKNEGVVDVDGTEIIAPNYDDVYILVTDDGRCYYNIEREGKQGICDKNGREIIALEYDKIWLEQIDSLRCYFKVERGREKGAFDMNGKTIIEMKKCKSLFYDKWTRHPSFVYEDASGKFVSTDISLDKDGDPYIDACYAYDQCFNEGNKYYRNKNYSKAISSYKKALEHKQTAEAYFNIGASYYNLKKYDDAITYFQHCCYCAPDESMENDAQKCINYCRQIIAQKAERREEIAEAIIGGVIGFAAGVVAGSMGVTPTPVNPYTGGNMDHLLDPNLAIAQAQQQQAEMNAVNQQLINLSIWQTEQQEYNTYLLMTSGGTSMTFDEWKALAAQAAMNESFNADMGYFTSDAPSESVIEYKGKLSPDQYQAAYRFYESSAQDYYRYLTMGGVREQDKNGNIQGKTVGQISGGNYTTWKQGLSQAQKEMKRIRQEAAQYGVIIQQSQWETATARY